MDLAAEMTTCPPTPTTISSDVVTSDEEEDDEDTQAQKIPPSRLRSRGGSRFLRTSSLGTISDSALTPKSQRSLSRSPTKRHTQPPTGSLSATKLNSTTGQ